MSKSKYVAYVSTYTMGDNHGIKIYDVDMANGRLKEKAEVEITNSSYVTISHSGKFLYSITDFGVEAFKILEDGNLELINKASINVIFPLIMKISSCSVQDIMMARSQCFVLILRPVK